jgi:hypothetical protein
VLLTGTVCLDPAQRAIAIWIGPPVWLACAQEPLIKGYVLENTNLFRLHLASEAYGIALEDPTAKFSNLSLHFVGF